MADAFQEERAWIMREVLINDAYRYNNARKLWIQSFQRHDGGTKPEFKLRHGRKLLNLKEKPLNVKRCNFRSLLTSLVQFIDHNA